MAHPRIEEVSDSDDDAAFSDPSEDDIDDFAESDILRQVQPKQTSQPTASRPSQPLQQQQQQIPRQQVIGNGPPPEFGRFAALYPVYFDRARSRAQGRRVGTPLAVDNPLARDIVAACASLGLRTVFEPTKTHPKDWANPGRVRVDLAPVKANGRSEGGATIQNKHHLYILISRYLKAHPTTEHSAGLRETVRGAPPPPPLDEPYPRPAVPRGWKLPTLVPYLSPAMTGGGVSENLFQDVMKEMQGAGGAGGPGGMGGMQQAMQAALSGMGGAGGGAGAIGPGDSGGSAKKSKKGKGKA